MSKGTDALKEAFRDYNVSGNPATGVNEPDKPEIRSALDTLAIDIAAASVDDPDAIEDLMQPFVDAAEAGAELAEAWAQSPTAPDPADPASKSAKTIALEISGAVTQLDQMTKSLTRKTTLVATSSVSGYYVQYTDAAILPLAAYSYSRFTVTAGDVLYLSAALLGNNTALAVFTDNAGVKVSHYIVAPSGTVPAVYTDEPVTVPVGATRLLMTSRTIDTETHPLTAKLGVFDDAVADQLYANVQDTASLDIRVDNLETTLSALEPSTPTAAEDGYYVNKLDGALVALSGYRYARFAVTPGEKIYLTARILGGTTALVVFTDASGAYVSRAYDAPSGVAADYTDQEVTVPSGAAFASMTCQSSSPIPLTLKSLVLANDVASRLATVESEVAGGSDIIYWQGKSVVWIGNSIPDGSSIGSYPAMLASELGFTVTKETTGGMAYRGGVRSKVVAGTDPYGWAGASWTGLMWSLGMTLAEKQYLIDNWATIRTTLTNSPPATLNSTQINQALSCCYENRLVARHLGANRKDWYVFDNPFNDRVMAEDLTTAGIGSEDRLTYLGTMNFLIRLIFEDNPHANIAMVGHYEDIRHPTLVASQKMVSDLWAIPFVSTSDKLGWSQRPITVNGSWGSVGGGLFAWTAGTGSQTLTVLRRNIPDDVHPAQDASGEALRRQKDAIKVGFRGLR